MTNLHYFDLFVTVSKSREHLKVSPRAKGYYKCQTVPLNRNRKYRLKFP